jgi:hypothetical protein
MVVSANGVKPYIIQRRRVILVFEEPEYSGIHIEARLDVDLRTFLDLQSLAGASESNADDLRAAFQMFGDEILSSWNLEDEDGRVLPADATGFLSLPPTLATKVLGAWTEAASTPGEVLASV